MRVWPIVFAISTVLAGAFVSPSPLSTGPHAGTYVPIPFENGTQVVIFEANPPNGSFSIHRFPVYEVIDKGVEFTTVQNETVNLTSDGVYLTIRCERPYLDGRGCNIVGAGLDGIPGFPRELWAYPLVNYTLGTGGNASTVACAEGPPYRLDPPFGACTTILGDGFSELVLSFGTSHSPDEFATLSLEVTGGHFPGTITFRAEVDDPSRIFFRWDFDQDLMIDTPWRLSLTMSDTIDRYYGPGERPHYACVQAWDGVSTDEANQLVEVACIDLEGLNSPPEIKGIDSPGPVPEGSPFSISVDFVDPDPNDTHTAFVDFSYGPNLTVAVDEQNMGNHVAGNFSANHTYGDNGNFSVIVGVTDSNGAIATKELFVDVLNVRPDVELGVSGGEGLGLALRIAGEKWHDVAVHIFEDITEIRSGTLVREPGSPDEQTLWFEDFQMNRSRAYAVEVVYTPLDDEVNGQVWGATPAWLLLYSGGTEVARLHHVFIVRQEETWTWRVDDMSSRFPQVAEYTVFLNVTDPGSDDLTIRLEFSTGPVTEIVVYSGVGPDPYPSPEVKPTTLNWVSHLTIEVPCVLRVEVADDDGGLTELVHWF
ncbi:MAG: hypothetical protein ACE5QF_09355 [Thermoplasmata archaeon]